MFFFAARRALLCTPAEVRSAAKELSHAALDTILAMEGDGASLQRVKAIALVLKSSEADDFFKLVVGETAGIMDQSKPIFLSQERHDSVKPLHGLISDEEFRNKCSTIILRLTAGLEGTSQFLSCFFMRVKDNCALFRLSKMRERLPPPSMAQAEDRLENVLYISGWVLWKTKRMCWKNIKKERNTIVFQYIKKSFSEGGENAENIADPKVRKWIDRKNRGETVNGKRVNGLTVPSDAAFKFFSRLDAHVEAFESRNGLKTQLSQEALLSKVYDDLQLLDLWGKLVSGMEEWLQQELLEFVTNVYRKLVGNAVAKRMVRGLFKRSTVATRTNLKRNPSSSRPIKQASTRSRTTNQKPSRQPKK